jgi:hypothetical protein
VTGQPTPDKPTTGQPTEPVRAEQPVQSEQPEQPVQLELPVDEPAAAASEHGLAGRFSRFAPPALSGRGLGRNAVAAAAVAVLLLIGAGAAGFAIAGGDGDGDRGRDGRGGGNSERSDRFDDDSSDNDEAPLTGDVLAQVAAAVEEAYPGALIERAETDDDGVYEAHVTTVDGEELTVELDEAFAITGTEEDQ